MYEHIHVDDDKEASTVSVITFLRDSIVCWLLAPSHSQNDNNNDEANNDDASNATERGDDVVSVVARFANVHVVFATPAKCAVASIVVLHTFDFITYLNL